jgi:hypothetical protein
MTAPVIPPVGPDVTTAPDPQLPSSTFDTVAYAFTLSLTPFKGGLDTLASNVYGNSLIAYNSATASAASEVASAGHVTAAAGHVTAAAGQVTAAQNWATSLTEVSGGLYGAKYYAQVAQAAVATLPSGTINDGMTSTSSVWSSSKVNAEITAAIANSTPHLFNLTSGVI